jgi:hypothetical protein
MNIQLDFQEREIAKCKHIFEDLQKIANKCNYVFIKNYFSCIFFVCLFFYIKDKFECNFLDIIFVSYEKLKFGKRKLK